MTDIDDRPTLAERYSSAMGSSHLKLSTRDEGACDLDVIIAAAWSGDSLGAMLHRLAAEYDTARGAQMLAIRQADMRSTAMDNLRRKLNDPDIEAGRKVELLAEYRLNEREAGREALTNRLAILSQLKTLAQVKESLGTWAIEQAGRRGFMKLGPMPTALAEVKGWRAALDLRLKTIASLTGRTLDAWLDPTCHKCEGRGFWGGYGSPRTNCKACRGTGKRTAVLGANPDERSFCGLLAAEMTAMVQDVETEMSRRLR